MDARDLEVRCDTCDAGFAVGTKVCVHCQTRLGRRSLDAAFEGALSPHRPEVAEASARAPVDLLQEGPDPEEDAGGERRTGVSGALVQAAFVVGFMALSFLTRACEGG